MIEQVILLKSVSKYFSTSIRRSLFGSVLYLVRSISLLRLRNSSFDRKFKAIDDVSFSIYRGEKIALVGENGSGKSTLLKILAGIYRVDSGEFSVFGRVASLLTGGAVFSPVLTIEENIKILYAAYSGGGLQTTEKLDEIIQFSGIKKSLADTTGLISAGMRLRLALSVILFSDADIYLLDEIVSVVDAKFREKVAQKLSALGKEKTVIVVSHNYDFLDSFATRRITLKDGRIVSA